MYDSIWAFRFVSLSLSLISSMFRRGWVDHHPERRLRERALAGSATPLRQRRQRGQLCALALAPVDAAAADVGAAGSRLDLETSAGDGRLAVLVRLDAALFPDQVSTAT